MATQQYTIEIDGDISGLQAAINQANGQLENIQGKKYRVSMDVDINRAAFDKVINQIQNEKVKVQIEYDRTKSAASSKKAILKDIDTINNAVQNKLKGSQARKIVNDQIQSLKSDLSSGMYDLNDKDSLSQFQSRLKTIMDMARKAKHIFRNDFQLSDESNKTLDQLKSDAGISDYKGNLTNLQRIYSSYKQKLGQDEARLNKILNGKTQGVLNKKFIDTSGKASVDLTTKAINDRITANAKSIEQETKKSSAKSTLGNDISDQTSKLQKLKATYQSLQSDLTKIGTSTSDIDANMQNLKVSIDTGDLQQSSTIIENVKKQISDLKQNIADGAPVKQAIDTNNIINQAQEIVSSMEKAGSSVDDLKNKIKEMNSAASSGDIGKVKSLGDEITQAANQSSDQYDKRKKQIEQIKKFYSDTGMNMSSSVANKINSLYGTLYSSGYMNFSKFDEQFATAKRRIGNQISASLTKQYSKMSVWASDRLDSGKYVNSAIPALNNLKSAINDLKGLDIDQKTGLFKVDTAQAVSAIKKYEDAVQSAKKECSDASNILSNPISNDKLSKQISQFVANNSRLTSDFVNDCQKIQSALKDTNLTQKQYGQYFSKFLNIQEQAYKKGLTGGNTLSQQISTSLKNKTAELFSNFFAYQDIINYARQIASVVTEVNSAQIELQKVSDASWTRIQQDFETSAQTAQEMGATISDVITSTADWARLNILVS